MTLADQIKRPTALYAVVGAGDLVVNRIRTTAATDPRAAQGQVQGQLHSAQSTAQQQLDALVAELRTLPDRAQSAALDALDQAVTVYGELARRGETLVTRIRNQQATQDTVAQTRTTVAQAKGTATTARRQASSGVAATGDTAKRTATTAKRTATTAKRTATRTTKATSTRAKATRTSGTKTAKKASKAVSDAAGKVGD